MRNSRSRFAAAVSCLWILVAQTQTLGGAAVREGTWEGEIRKGEKCIFLENARLKVTILKKGAYIISVVDKRSEEDFINSAKANSSQNHGLYDRIGELGSHYYRLNDPKHFANREYAVEQLAPGALRFTCQSSAVQVVRTVKLDDALPKLRIDVKYTSLSEEALKMQIVLFTQLNLNQAPVSYNQAVVMPSEHTLVKWTAETRGHPGPTTKCGWWLVADRDSKKSVVMTYPTDGSVESIYLYRIPRWLHLIPFSPSKLMQKGDTLSLWQEYQFLTGAGDARALAAKDVSVTPGEFARLKAALLEELATPPVKPGQPRVVALPKLEPENCIEPPLGGKPLATVAVVRNAVYDHPTKLDAQTWSSLDRLLAAVAEAKASRADLFVVCGASANAVENELKLTKQAAALSGLPVAFAPSRADAKDTALFEKLLGPKNWVRKVQDVSFISFAPGEEDWLETAIKKAGSSRIVVVGQHAPTEIAKKTKVTLALCRQNTGMPSFVRIGNWPVLYVPEVQGYGQVGTAVVNIFPDHLDVLAKPLGGALGPRLYLGNDGKSPALGIPPSVKGQPILKVAHITDTQLHLPSRLQTPDEKSLDQENMMKAVAEINSLGVDFAVNTGDLINVGADEEQWKLYTALKKPLKVPLYEVLGNHDWDKATPEGEYITTNYKKYIDDPVFYDFEKGGILFVGFGTAVTRPEDLRQRLPKARKARCTVLMYHDPMTTVKGYNWWSPELYQAAQDLIPTVSLAGHTHRLQWNEVGDVREFVSSALAWTKTGDQAWNGFFLHLFYADKLVSSYKRLGCDDLFFTVVTPYREW